MKPRKIDIGTGSDRQEHAAIGSEPQPASQQTVEAQAENA